MPVLDKGLVYTRSRNLRQGQSSQGGEVSASVGYPTLERKARMPPNSGITVRHLQDWNFLLLFERLVRVRTARQLRLCSRER